MVMMKGLMGSCLNHETALDHIKAKARLTEDELAKLKAWKTVQEKKLALSKEARGELEKQIELLRQVLEDKEKEISDTKDQYCQAKEEAIHEYRDSDPLLAELGSSFAKGFDDCLRQVKTSFPDLDLYHVPRPQCSMSILRAQMNYSLMMPLSMTLVVTERLLLKAKLNPSWTTLVILTKILPSISSLCKNVFFFF